MNSLRVELSESQLGLLADMIASRLSKGTAQAQDGKPVSQSQAAELLGLSRSTICRYIAAGKISTVPGCRDRIPQSEIRRMRGEPV